VWRQNQQNNLQNSNWSSERNWKQRWWRMQRRGCPLTAFTRGIRTSIYFDGYNVHTCLSEVCSRIFLKFEANINASIQSLLITCYSLQHYLLPRYVERSEVNVGKVVGKVWVRWDLASVNRLHPLLCAVPRFRVRVKRQGFNKRLGYLETI
jgi:hypothetical protein